MRVPVITFTMPGTTNKMTKNIYFFSSHSHSFLLFFTSRYHLKQFFASTSVSFSFSLGIVSLFPRIVYLSMSLLHMKGHVWPEKRIEFFTHSLFQDEKPTHSPDAANLLYLKEMNLLVSLVFSAHSFLVLILQFCCRDTRKKEDPHCLSPIFSIVFFSDLMPRTEQEEGGGRLQGPLLFFESTLTVIQESHSFLLICCIMQWCSHHQKLQIMMSKLLTIQ